MLTRAEMQADAHAIELGADTYQTTTLHFDTEQTQAAIGCNSSGSPMD
jgi:hypothetical protein